MEILSWERLSTHLDRGVPALLSMGGTHQVQIGIDPSVGRLFLRVPVDSGAEVPPSTFTELAVEQTLVNGDPVLEISVDSSHLFTEFHRLGGLFTEELEREGQTPVDAFLAVVERWRELTAVRRLLSVDEQLGLFGELAVLEALTGKYGPGAIEAWTARVGDIPERHDFRIGAVDLEVKSTRGSRRRHVIHGLRQLHPAQGHELFLVSLQFESAGLGGGRSLPERVDRIRTALSGAEAALKLFVDKLKAAGFLDYDAAYYRTRYTAADAPMLIPVNEYCPRLTSAAIRTAIGPDLAVRIEPDVVYRIDVDGLGTPLATCDESMGVGPVEIV
jgi:hypothetical protein